MKRLFFGLYMMLLLSTFTSSQANQSQSKVRDEASTYRNATLLKLTARARTQSREIRHTSLLDTTIVDDTIVTYEFTIRSGARSYISHYTPDQPLNLPRAWRRRPVPVLIRVRKRTLYITIPEAGEVASHIVSQTSTAN